MQALTLHGRRGLPITGSRVLVPGLAFKENCPDVRNTRVIDIIERLGEYGVTVDVCDPWVDAAEAKTEYGLDLVAWDTLQSGYSGTVLAVRHTSSSATPDLGCANWLEKV